MRRRSPVDRGPDQIGYAYDGDGNKVVRSTNESGALETIQFLNDVATALPVVLSEDGPTTDINYLYGLGLIAEETNTAGRVPAAFFYHPDGLGSTVALTDANGRGQSGLSGRAWDTRRRGLDVAFASLRCTPASGVN